MPLLFPDSQPVSHVAVSTCGCPGGTRLSPCPVRPGQDGLAEQRPHLGPVTRMQSWGLNGAAAQHEPVFAEVLGSPDSLRRTSEQAEVLPGKECGLYERALPRS